MSGKRYAAHRLAWLYVYGSLPDKHIDHIDGDRTNNAIANLRLATNAENAWNAQKSRSNRSGVKGVSWDKGRGKWVARLKAGGKIVFNKYFEDLDEARAEIEHQRRLAHGEYANAGMHKHVAEDLDGF